MSIYNSRCDWEWKDLGRFICLKIWPRLPNLSEKAIYPESKKSDKPAIKGVIRDTFGNIRYIVPYNNSFNDLPGEKISERNGRQLSIYQHDHQLSDQEATTSTSRESEKPIIRKTD